LVGSFTEASFTTESFTTGPLTSFKLGDLEDVDTTGARQGYHIVFQAKDAIWRAKRVNIAEGTRNVRHC